MQETQVQTLIWEEPTCCRATKRMHLNCLALPGGSDGKESICNAGDPDLILGGEDPLEKGQTAHSSILGASLVVRMVKNLPSMRETWVRSLGWEDPLEEGMATHSSILAWTIPMDRGGWWATAHGITMSQT